MAIALSYCFFIFLFIYFFHFLLSSTDTSQTGSWLFPDICCEVTVGSEGGDENDYNFETERSGVSTSTLRAFA